VSYETTLKQDIAIFPKTTKINAVILSEAKNPCISLLPLLLWFPFSMTVSATRVPHSSQLHRDEWECKPSPSASSLLSKLALAALLLTVPLQTVHAQGCTQCRDNTAATPSATQRAYRNAILILIVPAGGLFIATLALFKRER
jgi:hypothetical protein